MTRHCLAIVLAVSCAGCVTDRTPDPVPTQPIRIVCLPMVQYSTADQAEFADEVARLQPDAQKQVIRFLGDYKAMREANRACDK